METNVLMQGDALHVLRSLPGGVVQTCITSPPYLGLRDYKLPPIIWGDPGGCDHQWENWQENHDVREETQHGKSRTTDRAYGDASRRFDGNHQKHSAGTFCTLCGAWQGCMGLEPSPQLYVAHLVEVFREVRRVLRKDGTCWLVMGDSFAGSWGNYAPQGIKGVQRERTEGGQRWERRAYDNTTFLPPTAKSKGFGLKDKDLIMMPSRLALALQEDGWYLRQDIIWEKPNAMPESVRDRPTSSHEHVFLLAKSERYYYDADAIREPHTMKPQRRLEQRHSQRDASMRPDKVYPYKLRDIPGVEGNPAGRNKRSVWHYNTQPYAKAHFAVFPEKLVEPMVLAGTSAYGACETCGAPWKRLRERTGHVNKRGNAHVPHHDPSKTTSTGWAPLTRATGTWAPTCKCSVNTGAASSIVLDPFAGAGTVAVVAKRLGREWLGIELSKPYVEMAKERIESTPAPVALPTLEKGA